MDMWQKMLAGITKIIYWNELEDDELIRQMECAVEEGRKIWSGKNSFVDPEEVERYRETWCDAYHTAKRKTEKLTYGWGVSGKRIKKSAPSFIALYEQLPKILSDHNEAIAEKRIEHAQKLILPVEGRTLDHQQMLCITKEARNHLVLAGAGTGKTTTIIGYVKYLLNQKICTPDDILVLSFTKASAEEMGERLSKELGTTIAAYTFHRLGIEIITEVKGKKPKIFSKDIRQFVREKLNQLVTNSDYLRKLCNYLIYCGGEQKTEFDFSTEQEYQAYLKCSPPVTLKKERVKSYGELDIANFLTQNGISYIYERAYPIDTRTKEYAQYHPDFYLPEFDVYIEYFGINRNGEVPAYFSGKNGMSATQIYQEGMKWKRNLHQENSTCLVEVYAYEKLEGTLLERLEERLKAAGVVFHSRTAEDIWEEIGGTENQKLDRIAELFGTIITLVKSNNCTLKDVEARCTKSDNVRSVRTAVELVEPIFGAYQEYLEKSEEIDFNDMINLAAYYVREGRYSHPFHYVIIDEYQDISQARYNLLHALREKRDYRLFCVGDDWQSIYRFSGSDIGFILHFEKYWGASEISKIETTYRFPQSLIEISGNFIMQNPTQKKKLLKSISDKRNFSMEKITAAKETFAIEQVADRLRDLPQESSVLFIGRYRFDIRALDAHPDFSYKFNAVAGKTEITYAKRKDLEISFMTAHGSKGLQAEYVFLLNNKAYGMGFPSQITDAPILKMLLDNCDDYPFAEERRLFYVAITRAKTKVWLVTIKGNESVFVKEIERAYGEEMRKEQYRCPQCGGHLVRRSGPYGEFFGCANYKSAGCRYKRVIRNKNKTSQ